MYVRERLRVYAIWLVGFLIWLVGSFIIILSVTKTNYYAGSEWLLSVVERIFTYPIVKWIWPWLPRELLSVQLILAVGLVILSGIFAQRAFYMNSIIREAARSNEVKKLMEKKAQYRQSVGGITAGRDITITQTQIANEAKLDAWSDSFWKGPIWLDNYNCDCDHHWRGLYLRDGTDAVTGSARRRG